MREKTANIGDVENKYRLPASLGMHNYDDLPEVPPFRGKNRPQVIYRFLAPR